LIGLAVRTPDGRELGRVERLLETGANDVLVLRGEGRERLVPFIEAVVREVDLEGGRLVADWDPDF
jgi:16S rRNA processing protein RimM